MMQYLARRLGLPVGRQPRHLAFVTVLTETERAGELRIEHADAIHREAIPQFLGRCRD